MTDRENREKILELCMENEEHYWNLPGYGLIPDYFIRYWELHNAVLEYFGEVPYDFPLRHHDQKT